MELGDTEDEEGEGGGQVVVHGSGQQPFLRSRIEINGFLKWSLFAMFFFLLFLFLLSTRHTHTQSHPR